LKYPKASIVIMRKTLASSYGTVLKTFTEKVLGEDTDGVVKAFGGSKPEWFDYPRGSRIWVAGMDKASKVLSSEHDIVYVVQSEELTLDDWETLTTRTTGRAGHMPYNQLIGDANPSWPHHWMYDRSGITRFTSIHQNNPMLFDQKTGSITSQGQITLGILGRLTGLRWKRLFKGEAASAEGVVYDGYDSTVHLIDRFDIPSDWRRFRAVDFGFTNPFVCQWWAVDHDGRMYRYREIYYTQRLVEDHARLINELSVGERYETTVCDHDAEDSATLRRYGIITEHAHKEISLGIQEVQSRLRIREDKKPRLFLLRDSLVEVDPFLRAEFKPVCTEDEFSSYSWPKAADGKPQKEVPIDVDNHGMDTTRYAAMYLNRPKKQAKSHAG
jgi:phage terminase large subunit